MYIGLVVAGLVLSVVGLIKEHPVTAVGVGLLAAALLVKAI